MRDPYDVLGVDSSASHDEIRKAYRALARRWHPDLHPDEPEAEARFKEVASAWEVLSDPKRRGVLDGGVGPRGVDDEAWDGVASAIERAESWLHRGVLVEVASAWRGHGAEALVSAIQDRSWVHPSGLPKASWWARRRAAQLSKEIVVTLSEWPQPRPLQVVRHRKQWELRFSAERLVEADWGTTDLDRVMLELLVDTALRCLAAGRVVGDPTAPGALRSAQERDTWEQRRWQFKVGLWGAVGLWIVVMITAGKMNW